MHLPYLCFFDCYVDIDVFIYSASACAFLIAMLILMYSFIVLVPVLF